MYNQKIALITGANKGIGLEIARQLGKRGIVVLLGARDIEKGKHAANELVTSGINAEAVHLDVTDQSTAQQLAEYITEKYGKIDILVNNAGIVGSGKVPSETTLDDIKAVYATNVFGVVSVTNAMLALLKKSEAGRIVNTSSGGGSIERMIDVSAPFYEYNLLSYNTSKTALNAVTISYAKELANTNIKVNAGNPGYVATDLNGHNGTLTVAEGAKILVDLALLNENGPTGTFQGADGVEPW